MKHTCLLLLTAVCLLGRNGFCSERPTAPDPKNSNATQSVATTSSEETVRIKGLVKGPKGPLPGAVVQLNGSSTLVVTAEGGKFEMDVPASLPNVEVTCSYAGLQDVIMKLSTSSPTAVIQLKPAVRPKVEPTIESGWW